MSGFETHFDSCMVGDMLFGLKNPAAAGNLPCSFYLGGVKNSPSSF